MVSGSSAVSDSLLEAFRALQSSLRPFRGVFLQDTLFLSKMSTTPDQLVVPVQPDGADKLDSDTEELADGLASKMAAPAANAEAADGLPEQQQQEDELAHAAAISEPSAPPPAPTILDPPAPHPCGAERTAPPACPTAPTHPPFHFLGRLSGQEHARR